jgi:hypothetical protein
MLVSAETPTSDLDYGDVYFEESKGRELPLVYFGLGYATGVSNSFLDLHSVMGNAQIRVWKYISTGILGQVIRADYSEAGDQINRLNQSGFVVHYPTPRWGVFSHSQMDLMLGKWNVLNLTAIQVDLLIGGGAGLLQKQNEFEGPSHGEATYLWSIEQRIQFNERFGLSVSGFGHGGGIYFQAGLFSNFF